MLVQIQHVLLAPSLSLSLSLSPHAHTPSLHIFSFTISLKLPPYAASTRLLLTPPPHAFSLRLLLTPPPQWHSGVSFVSNSLIYKLSLDEPHAPFQLVQQLPSSGAHDVEFIVPDRHGGGGDYWVSDWHAGWGSAGGSDATGDAAGGSASDVALAAASSNSADAAWLLVANARNESSQSVASELYAYDGQRFVLRQRVQTMGAHDWEPLQLDGSLAFAVANQGDGRFCRCDTATSTSHSYRVHRSGTLLPLSASPLPRHSNNSIGLFSFASTGLVDRGTLPIGCTVFLRSFRVAGRVFLVAAVERDGDDPNDHSSYRTKSIIFEWQ